MFVGSSLCDKLSVLIIDNRYPGFSKHTHIRANNSEVDLSLQWLIVQGQSTHYWRRLALCLAGCGLALRLLTRLCVFF